MRGLVLGKRFGEILEKGKKLNKFKILKVSRLMNKKVELE
ncbi:Uncharacterised protein [Escherichia coli]|nr:Uncharacterised protein [Escherichia coli]